MNAESHRLTTVVQSQSGAHNQVTNDLIRGRSHRAPQATLTISMASVGVPKAMASSSFWEDFSGTCKRGSWLETRPRVTGCWSFVAAFTRASVSSKLDLRKRSQSIIRIVSLETHRSLLGSSQHPTERSLPSLCPRKDNPQ